MVSRPDSLKKTAPSTKVAGRSLVLETIIRELDAAAKKAKSGSKQQFAQHLSTALALKVANALRPAFKGILPNSDGTKQESQARTSKGLKRLDVNYSTIRLGLALGVSIKTTDAPEGERKNYAKNVTGRDAELRAEAEDYHERQPYAVLVALYFVPFASCDNATERAPSSFATIAKTLRFRGGRQGPKDLTTLFEAAYVGLYENEGAERGRVRFFDVSLDPPRSGRPRLTLSFEELVGSIQRIYDDRNVTFKFADQLQPIVSSGETDNAET